MFFTDPNQQYYGGGYPQGGYPPPGGYPQGGYPQPGGYPQGGYPPTGGYPQGGYPPPGAPEGYPPGGFVPNQPGFVPPPQNDYGGYEDPEAPKNFSFDDQSVRKGFIRKVYIILMVCKKSEVSDVFLFINANVCIFLYRDNCWLPLVLWLYLLYTNQQKILL